MEVYLCIYHIVHQDEIQRVQRFDSHFHFLFFFFFFFFFFVYLKKNKKIYKKKKKKNLKIFTFTEKSEYHKTRYTIYF